MGTKDLEIAVLRQEIERLKGHIEEHQSRDALQQMEIERLRDEVRSAHFDGYMAGVGDSEDYDHDSMKMEVEAWKDRAALEGDDE